MIIALPLHLHAPAAIAAMQAGLHVITEKLMGHSVHECKEMARVAKHDRPAPGHRPPAALQHPLRQRDGHRSSAACSATCTTSAPSGTAATCPATTVGSSRCRRAAKPKDALAKRAGQEAEERPRSNWPRPAAASDRPVAKPRRPARGPDRRRDPGTTDGKTPAETFGYESKQITDAAARWSTTARPSRS